MEGSSGRPRLLMTMLVSVGCFVASEAAFAGIIVNGGFENPAVVSVSPNALDHWERRYGTELSGWNAPGGIVHFDSVYSPVSEGRQAVQLERPGASIYQSFVTVPGESYLVSFDLSAFGVGYGFVSSLEVSVGTVTRIFDGSYSNFDRHTVEFLADDAVTTLNFENVGADGTYPHIDNVALQSVRDLPEPVSLALVAAGAIGIVLTRKRSSLRK
jgi:hypothetical protein